MPIPTNKNKDTTKNKDTSGGVPSYAQPVSLAAHTALFPSQPQKIRVVIFSFVCAAFIRKETKRNEKKRKETKRNAHRTLP